MSDEGMRDGEMGVDHHDLIYKNNGTSQDNNGSGNPTLSSEHSGDANVTSSYSYSPRLLMNLGGVNMPRASDLLFGVSIFAEATKAKIIDLAHSAFDELLRIGVVGKPLWHSQVDYRFEILNDIEYLRQFGQVDTTLREIMKLVEVNDPQTLPSFNSFGTQYQTSEPAHEAALQIEASRETAFVNMSPISLVELLMDVNQWSRVFHKLVSRAMILVTFLEGVEGSCDGKLHVMNTEFHLPTALVRSRECYFARYCKQLSHEKWVVTDVSLEKFFPSPSNNFRKRPSGCLITGMPNGFSKVVWIEHVEADHSQLSDNFKPLVTSCLAFGAPCWIASLVRHSKWFQSLNAPTAYADQGVRIPQSGWTSFLKLADRMMRKFCVNVSATTDNPWRRKFCVNVSATDVKLMIKNDLEGFAKKPPGTPVVFTTSVWLEVSPHRLFNFLRHESSRREWDKLSQTLTIQEFSCIVKDDRSGNRVSLMRAITSEGKTEIFYLQESYTDSTGFYVVYAPLDEQALLALSKGCNPDNVIVLPSGFAILPGPGGLPVEGEGKDRGSNTGSLLTVGFNIIDWSITNETPITLESVQSIYGVIADTVTAIKDAVQYHNRLNNWMNEE